MDRKELVKVLGEHYGVKPNYLGAPTFAYEIIAAEGLTFIVDREGKIKNLEGAEFELERLLHGPEEIVAEEVLSNELYLPMDGHTGVTLRNLVNMLSSKQGLIKRAIGIKTDIVTAEFVEGINNVKLVTIEDFEVSVRDIGIEKIPGIRFNFLNKTLNFNFLNTLEDTETAIQFAKALNNGAKKLKQSSPKPTETDNERFTFRTYLVRLGFIGPGYKKSREVLLKDLKGNGAFRKGKQL